jgi:hypothetical protein
MVAGMLGHSSPSIVSTYAKVVDEFRRQAIEKLEGFRSKMMSNPAKSETNRGRDISNDRRWVN